MTTKNNILFCEISSLNQLKKSANTFFINNIIYKPTLKTMLIEFLFYGVNLLCLLLSQAL